jgi:DNA polymerase II large subunit
MEVMADLAYCVKCKEKREIKDAHQVTMKNGRAALQGTCPVCGTRLNRILPGAGKK